MNPDKEMKPSVMVMNEQSIRFDFGSTINSKTYETIQRFCDLIESYWNPLIEEVVPSYQTVTVFFLRELVNPSEMIQGFLSVWEEGTVHARPVNVRNLTIPVCYDSSFSEDMARVIEQTKLTREKVVSIHTSTNYTVYMIGFLPGFPYLGELPKELHVRRLDKPRLLVPKGSVGIGGTQTGIYSIESPGGWNIIGRTPIDLYNPKYADPFLIQTGDQLSFYSISLEEFYSIQKRLEREPEMMKKYVREVSR